MLPWIHTAGARFGLGIWASNAVLLILLSHLIYSMKVHKKMILMTPPLNSNGTILHSLTLTVLFYFSEKMSGSLLILLILCNIFMELQEKLGNCNTTDPVIVHE